MDILVRLYVRHDSDLLNLYRNKNFSLASAMRDSILAYVRNEPVKYVMPAPYLEIKEDIRNASLHLYFHPEEDEDAIKLLLGVREGARCALIKNIFRGYMMYPNVYCCFENKEYALQHAMAVFGNTNQKVCVTGQEFVRGRGNRGRRKDRDDYGVITPKKVTDDMVEDKVDFKKENVEENIVKKEDSLNVKNNQTTESVASETKYDDSDLKATQVEEQQSSGMELDLNDEASQDALMSAFLNITDNT